MPTAIVTGSGGLIGSESVQHFVEAGYDVIGLDNDMRAYFFGPAASTAPTTDRLLRTLGGAFQALELDIRDAEAVDRVFAEQAASLELVIHTAAKPSHDWAAKAAYYADCIGRGSSDAAWKFISSVYDAQKDITVANADEKLTALADQAGVKGAETAVCAAKPETIGRIQRSIALGASLEVNGTPTLFINGRKISNVGGLPYDVLKTLTEYAAKGGAN